MTRDSCKISVIVAAYNEAPIIAGNIRRILATLKERPEMTWELILVNDGSSDGTGDILEEVAEGEPGVAAIHHRRNLGQGRALRTGFHLCRGETIITLDADLSYGPEYIWLLYESLVRQRLDISLASPYVAGGTVRNVPLYRYLLSRWGNRYLARMSSYHVSTITCVVRAYRREVWEHLYLTADGMELQLEILMKASMLGFRVGEIPAALVWSEGKAKDAGLRRISKMKILRTIRLYLKMGWLFRPAYIVIFLSLLLLLPGLYMGAWAMWRAGVNAHRYLLSGLDFNWAVSYGLQEAFSKTPYSFIISGILIIMGLQMIVFGLLIVQSKFYFDELYRLGQTLLTGTRGERPQMNKIRE